MFSDSPRVLSRRCLTIAALAAAGVTVTAACGSSAGGQGKAKTGPSVFSSGPGLIQARNFGEDNRRQITIAKPDGSIVHRVNLPFEPLNAFSIGAGRVLYTSQDDFVAVVDSNSGSSHTVKTPAQDYSVSSGLLSRTSYTQRWILLQPPSLTHSLLLDVTTGKTFDFAAQHNGDGLVTMAESAPDGKRVLVGEAQKTVLLDPATSRAEHEFESYSFPACFTTDGMAIVVEAPGGKPRRVVAFDPAGGTLKTLKERPRGDGPLNAVCSGTTVVVTAGSGGGIDLVSSDGAKSRHVSAAKDISRVTPAGDNRHVLLGSGGDTDGSWWMLDIDAGTVTALPALDGATPGAGTFAQRYRVFLPSGTSSNSLASKLLAFDSYTGKATPLTFAGRVVAGASGSASADGRVRSFLGSSVAVSSYVADLSTGLVRSYQHSTGVSPGGDRLLQTVPRGHVQITDLQSKILATVPADTGIWTGA